MQRQTLRFRPPAVALTPALAWVLRAAFAVDADADAVSRAAEATATPPAGAEPDGADGTDGAEACALARRLGVAARIGARRRVRELATDARTAAVAQMQAREAAAEIARVAAAAGIACCFLKGIALELRGDLLAGARSLGDVDVLVTREAAPALVAALVGDGFTPDVGEEYAHHLSPLLHSRLGSVEVHTELPGVTIAGRRRFATFQDLAATGLLERCADLAGEAFLPAPAALLAHLLAHALVQHGFRPDAYPLLRLIGDLIDFGVTSDGAEAQATVDAAIALVATSIPAVEARAAIDAAGALARGDVAIVESPDAAGALLRHLLAAALDDHYRSALKLQELAHPLHAGSRVRWRVALAWTAVALSDRQIDAIYGRPRTRLGYLGRRLWRPFDLLRRAVRARGRRRGG